MRSRSWQERDSLRRERIDSGYQLARLSKATHDHLRALLRDYPSIRGLDELIWELAVAERARLATPAPRRLTG